MDNRDFTMLLDSLLLASIIVIFLLTFVYCTIKIKDYYVSRKKK